MNSEKKKVKISFKRVVLNSISFVLAFLTFICTESAVNHPGFVDRFYSKGLYPHIAEFLSWFSRHISFSVWDIFWTVFIVLVIAGLVLAIFRKISFSRYFLRLAQTLAILYTVLYVVWGFNYFRPSIDKRLGWITGKADEKTFLAFLDTIIVHANSSLDSVSATEYPEIDRLVEESYCKNKNILGINYPNGNRRPKTMIFSSFISKMGVDGYFGPFFNEININRYLFPLDVPFILAHEKAHQFGIASEAEANLAAYIVCTTADDKRLQYSGYLYVMLYFLSDASRLDITRDYLKEINRKVISDLQKRRKYYLDLQNEELRKAQIATNNIYLKSNHIPGGVRNYNNVVALTISWYENKNSGK